MFDDLMRNAGLNERFAKAQGNHDAVDPEEAADYVGHFMRQAPPEVQQDVLRQYVSQLDPQQRQAFAQAMIQHGGTPVQNVRDDDDDDLTQALMRSGQALAGAHPQRPGAGMGDLFGMFGGMLGGGQGGQGNPMGGMLGGGQSGGLGGMLGGMGQQQQLDQQQGGMGGMGQLLQNPMARAGLVSLAAVIGSKLMNRR